MAVMKSLLFLLLLVFSFGCERTPESLEEWRNAEGGFEKMVEWATSSEEPMPVRIRAVEILIEEERLSSLKPLFDKIEDEGARAEIVDGVMPTIQSMWDKKDWPVIEQKANKSGLIKVERSEAVIAKDAGYYLWPYAKGASKEAIEAMLATWMSEDQDIRTQLGVTTVGQVSSRAGKDGISHMVKWIESTTKVATIARQIRLEASDEVQEQLATAIRKRAEAAHPNLKENELEFAVLETVHPAMVPYLETAIRDEKTPNDVVDGLMDLYVKIKKDTATPLFAELVAKRSGLIRWVSATRLIELRGKSGILVAAKALPLDIDAYVFDEEDGLKKETETFCNFASTEMVKQGVNSVDDVLKRALESDRWPVRVIGIRCVEIANAASLKPSVAALSSSKTPIPAWGEKMTVGQLATEVAGKL